MPKNYARCHSTGAADDTQSCAPGNLKCSTDGRSHQASMKIHGVLVRSQTRSKSVDDNLAAHWTFGV